jgi:peptidyl-prolyl cis-trans isomerase B (cyclophilin B)
MAMSSQASRLFLCFALIALVSCTSAPETDTLVTIHSDMGDITVILYDETPKHKASFINYVKKGNYDSTNFHRVIEGFMVQGGDIKANTKASADYNKLVPEEISLTHRNLRGALGAPRQANNINPERSSSTQFYIVTGRVYTEVELTTDVTKLNSGLTRYLQSVRHTELLDEFTMLEDSGRIEELQARIYNLKDDIAEELNLDLDKKGVTQEEITLYTTQGGAPHLDGDYTIFGEVLSGMDVVDKISLLEVDPSDKPKETLLLTMTLEELPRTEVTKLYGYIYPKPEE